MFDFQELLCSGHVTYHIWLCFIKFDGTVNRTNVTKNRNRES